MTCPSIMVQWYLGGVALSGYTTASVSYTLTAAQVKGTVLVFTCKVTNSVSSATSPTTTVTVA